MRSIRRKVGGEKRCNGLELDTSKSMHGRVELVQLKFLIRFILIIIDDVESLISLIVVNFFLSTIQFITIV